MTRNGRNGSTPFRGTKRKRHQSLFFIMYYTYILYSEKCNRYYIGYTSDVLARLERHNTGKVAATKNCTPYEIKATKSFQSELQARREELRLKKQKSRKYLEWLIAGNW